MRYILLDNYVLKAIFWKRNTPLKAVTDLRVKDRQSMRQTWLILTLLPVIWSACGGAENWARHHTNDEVKHIMDEVHEKCPEFTRVYSLPDIEHAHVPDETVNGSKLWVIQFSKTPGKHQLGVPEFKYIANMHGNEVVGKEILLRLIVFFCDVLSDRDDKILIPSNMFSKEQILWLLYNTDIHIMPSMNPDGWDLANAVTDKKSQEAWLIGRNNGNNVDLNRNFPDLDRKYYLNEQTPNHRNNHLDHFADGKKYAKLEAETKMVIAWIHSMSWVLSSNMHGGDLVANYPFDEAREGKPHASAPTPDDALFKNLALSYSQAHKKMAVEHKPCDMNGDFVKNGGITNGAEWYSVASGMQDYNYLSSNCFEITLELGCEKFPSGEKLPKFWLENFDAMLNYMFQTHIGIKGNVIVPKEFRDTPVVIKVYRLNEDEETYDYIDHDILSTTHGDYFRLLNDGIYRIVANLTKGTDQIIITVCEVEVGNNPTGLKEALQLNFDFSQGSQEYRCGDQRIQAPSYSKQDSYLDDLYRLMQNWRYWKPARNGY